MDESYFQKFSENAKKVLVSAQYLASEKHVAIGSEHLLLAMLINKDSLAHSILLSHDLSAEKLETVIAENVRLLGDSKYTHPELTDDTKHILDRSMNLAAQYGHVGVDTEHLLLALVTNEDSAATALLKQLEINPDRIKDQLINLFHELLQFDEPSNEIPQFISADAEEQVGARRRGRKERSTLEFFSTDLTKAAESATLDPVIGRETEISRVIQVLSRRTKNNPVLIGEPGVGKTAIAEGLAQRIVSGDVPANLLGKRLLSLDLAMLVAGTMYRGQFEERLKKALDELHKLGDTIVFVDELHTIIGAGSAEGSLDVAQILKPSLAKGTLRMIGATTLNEFQKYIEKDAALARRFQPIVVEEPSAPDTIKIMTGLRPYYENHHNVTITDEAIETAVRLSERYITDRFLPDKAIDVLDEAAARVRVQNNQDKQLILLSRELDKVISAKELAVTDERYDEAAKMQKREESLRKQLLRLNQKSPATKRAVVSAATIEFIISSLTGVPSVTLAKEDIAHVRELEKTLSKHIVGQAEAISAVSKSIRRSRTGISQTERPIGSFIFLGPSGVGKTELAKVIAREVYGKETALVKVDMSEFMERHNISRLLGAPAGYVGYEEGGKLTETIRRQPYSVVLLDEIEKAHPDFFNILLQILEDGYITDAKGRKIDFRQTIVIMTSNIGMEQLTKQASIGFNASTKNEERHAQEMYDSLKNDLLKSLKDHFKPEFLNRIDSTTVFRPLSKEDIRKIVDIEIEKLIERTAQKNIKMQVDLSARKYLVEHGYDPEYGARPIRRLVQNLLEDKIADALLEKTLDSHKTALFTRVGDEITLT